MPLPVFNDPIQEEEDINWKKFIERMVHEDYALMLGPEVILDDQINVEQWEEMVMVRYNMSNPMDIKKKYLNKTLVLDSSNVAKNLQELLMTRCFKVVITTIRHPFLEKVFDNVWGQDENGIPNYDICSYEAHDETCRKLPFNPGLNDSGDYRPLIVYLFGNISDCISDDLSDNATSYTRWRSRYESDKLAFNNLEFMEAITYWLSDKSSDLHNLLREKKLLVLGGKHDDWAFRFLLYALKGYEFESNDNRESKSEISIVLENNSPSDISLRKFLIDEKISISNQKTSEFIDQILLKYNEYLEKLSQKIQEADRSKMYDVFISYASEDYVLANRLQRKLSLEGLKVWMDYPMDEQANLKAFEPFKPVILKAIENSRTFVPLLTPITKASLEKDHKNPDKSKHRFFHSVEWKKAQELGKPIYPVAAGIMARNEVGEVGWSLAAPIFWPDEETRAEKELNLGFICNPVKDLSDKIKSHLPK